ncbi:MULTISPECIES: Rha family transcriptional regulator [unclassified Bacillus (in: firmicutes)]|uniref:Rha family transcriptional regulator n=1 Tax=unclassified Bacillus (in: firmicutes) TaxID=185979 RepID=UPI0008EFC8EF|nr:MULTISPECIES: Rha family transcriptional regulator [unclassified Bacillus (in: firmicutes)]SFI26705.1 phage regulatory protein, rha family [Bacillus sp. 71mf]SFS40360.1 phage regulatory protein, rha family [Bacillus sp. 103mf]
MYDQLAVVEEKFSLGVINQGGKLLVDSREVANMIGKRHTDLLRSIENYIKILENAKMRSQNFFVEDNYTTEGNNKAYKKYLLTRKGCDLVANKLTGEKGVLFTATYVMQFEKMKRQIQGEQEMLGNTYSQIKLLATGTLDLNNRVTSLEEKIETQLTIDYGQQRILEKSKAKRIYFLWENEHVDREIHDSTRKLFGLLGRNLKDTFNVNSYRDILKKDFEEALNFINGWRPIV